MVFGSSNRKFEQELVEYAKNVIDFLNNLLEDELNQENVKYRITIVTWDRKFTNKYHHLRTLQPQISP